MITMLIDGQETVDIMREAFPALQDFPPERVELLLKLSSGDWENMLPSVWDIVVSDPPSELGVRIADGPGDERTRNRRGQCLISRLNTPTIVIADALRKRT